MDLSGDWLKAIFTAATLIISYAGYRLSQRGQDTSTRQEHFAQEFAALKQVNDALTAENVRQRSTIVELREELRAAREEGESRWSRQMDRCRRVTDALASTLIGMQTAASPKKKAEAQAALHKLDEHRERDREEARERADE